MTSIRSFFSLIFILILSVALSSCGGSSSSGSDSSSDAANSLAGTYNGTATITGTSLGESATSTDPITITIAENGTVTIRDNKDGETGQGTLSGNKFTVTFNDQFIVDGGIICDQDLKFNGTVNGVNITGTISGSACNSVIVIIVSGTFQATKI